MTLNYNYYEEKQVWVIRGGETDQHIESIKSNNSIGINWGINTNLSNLNDWDDLKNIVRESLDLQTNNSAGQMTGQVWSLVWGIKIGDLVLSHIRATRTLMIGEVISDYEFIPSVIAENDSTDFKHIRHIKWFDQEIHIDNLNEELKLKVNTRKTISRINLDNAPQKIMAIYQNDESTINNDYLSESFNEQTILDLEQHSKDLIAEQIAINFRTHEMEKLVEGILKAKGFHTYSHGKGPDFGVDVLASKGDLGFESPKICVQVKSGQYRTDRPTLDQLIGTMQNFKAEYGLLVSWGGFKDSVLKEIDKHFFNVRLWDAEELIRQIFKEYENLPNEIKQKLPLKKIWILDS